MTVEAFTPAPPLTVAGIGPYAVPHPYTDGSLSVVIEQAGVRVTLAAGTDWTVTPTESTTAGNVYLSPAAAATYAGAALYTLRETQAEQGWQGVQGERERGLELQLDRLAMLAQEAQAGLAAALRVATGIPVIVPGLDCTIVWTGTGFVAGPSVSQIAAAQGSADLARRWATEAEGVPVVSGQFSAFHWAQIALAAALAGGPPLTRQIATDNTAGTDGGGDLSANRTIRLFGQALRLHQLAVNGLMVRVDATTLAGRSIAGTTDQISVANPAGATGNPTLSLVLPNQAEAEAGTDPNKPMPSLRVRQAIDARIVARRYKSTVTDIALDTAYTFAHGLGQLPFGSQAFLVCTTANRGWLVGDRIPIASSMFTFNENTGAAIVMDASLIKVRIGATNLMFMFGYDGSSRLGVSAANFDLEVTAWL